MPDLTHINKIVMIGDSLVNNPYGNDLVNPHAQGTQEFAEVGLSRIEIYGAGISGAMYPLTLTRINDEILPAFPGSDVLFVVQMGTNHLVWDGVLPYDESYTDYIDTIQTNTQTIFDTFAGRDLIITEVPFYGYGDDPEDVKGVRGYNENVLLPMFKNQQAEYLTSDDKTVLNYYDMAKRSQREVMNDDYIHKTAAGDRLLRWWTADRLKGLLTDGTMPEPVDKEVERKQKIIVNCESGSGYDAEFMYGNSFQVSDMTQTTPYTLKDSVKDLPTPVSVAFTRPDGGATDWYHADVDLRYTYNSEHAVYQDDIYTEPMLSRTARANGTRRLNFTGLVPGRDYSFGVIASSTSTGDESTVVTASWEDQSVATTVAAAPPEEPKYLNIKADNSGMANVDLSSTGIVVLSAFSLDWEDIRSRGRGMVRQVSEGLSSEMSSDIGG